jgi:hypothetical protein
MEETKYIEPTYQLGPPEDQKFVQAEANRISEEVCKAMLDGKVWTGEGEETVWAVQIAEQVKNRVRGALSLLLIVPVVPNTSHSSLLTPRPPFLKP